MNIYEYFNSKDIADYCQSINHKFNTIEMAWIIEMNETKTIKEKNKAFQELIDNYPNMKIEGNYKRINYKKLEEYVIDADTIHEYLRKLIEYREMIVDIFENNSKDAVFSIGDYSEGVLGLRERKNVLECVNDYFKGMTKESKYIFNSIEELMEFVRPLWNDDLYNRIIVHCTFDKGRGYKITAYFNYYGELVHICNEYVEIIERGIQTIYKCPGRFYDFFVRMPIPFEEGDIVEWEGMPYIIQALPHSDEEYMKRTSGRVYKHPLTLVNGRLDFATVYYISDEGKVCESHPTPGSGWGIGIDKLKYYRGKLEGDYSIYTHLRKYIKENGFNEARSWVWSGCPNL